MTFLIESWFWRGTQSAIFYYIACTPCMDYNHRRRRRNEAARYEKARSDLVTAQPGRIPQPGPFQTNEAWGEEMVAGPGPPKGWKSDKLIQKVKQNMRNQPKNRRSIDDVDPEMAEVPNDEIATPKQVSPNELPADLVPVGLSREATQPQDVVQERYHPGQDVAGVASPASPSTKSTPRHKLSTDHSSDSAPSTPPAFTEPVRIRRSSSGARPLAARKLSEGFVAVKDTLRSSIHPERWNWKRYEREDEVLWGFNERLNRIWDRATGHNASGQSGNESSQGTGRKRAATNDSDQYDYHQARNPEINELHPPVVSALPATREQAAWMLMAPPSRAVMEGKEKPNTEATMRWPLARIGTTKQEEALRRESMMAGLRMLAQTSSERPSSKARGKERASTASNDPYAADKSSSEEDEEGIEEREKENVPSLHPASFSFPFPIQHEQPPRPPAAQLYSEKRRSWSDTQDPVLPHTIDGTHSPSQRWSYSGIWVA